MKHRTEAYANYKEYLEHQPKKLRYAHVKRRLKEQREERVQWFEHQFAALKGVLNHVLCLGARFGEEVQAFRNLGYQAKGIDLEGYEDLVSVDDMNHLWNSQDGSVGTIYTNAFDHCWEGEQFIKTIDRVLQPHGLVIMHLNLGGVGDYEVHVPESVDEVVKLFPFNYKALISTPIERYKGMQHLLVLKKDVSQKVGLMPTVQWRRDYVRQAILSISRQLDVIHLYCGDCRPPAMLPDNVIVHTGPNIGVQGRWTPQTSGHVDGLAYIFGLDDDIRYPQNYVQRMIKALQKYDHEIVLGVHGRIFKPPMLDYYRDAEVINFKERSDPQRVHCVGTGTCLYHNKLLTLSPDDFCEPNMGDLLLGKICEQRGIPRWVIKRPEKWLRVLLPANAKSIWRDRHVNYDRRNELFRTVEWGTL